MPRVHAGDMIPVSKAAHGAEATGRACDRRLALLQRPYQDLQQDGFTGKMSAQQMHADHALELARA